MSGFLLALGGGGPGGPCTGRPLIKSRNSLFRVPAGPELDRPVIVSFIHRRRPNRPSTLPRAFRSCPNWSITPTMAKKEECVAINVDSNICATPENVWTME